MTALLAVLIGMVSLSCGDETLIGQTAHVRVVMSGMTTQTNAVDIVLTTGIYDFVATGMADAASAEITLKVFDEWAVEITSVLISLPLVDANAAPGDTGSGRKTGVQVVAGEQSLSIPFRWQGSTPAADVALDITFYDDPDILAVNTNPNPPVGPSTLVDVEVEVRNNEGPLTEMTVEALFIDGDNGTVINRVALDSAGGGWFRGTIAAPATSGDHRLRIVATDATGGTTQHEVIYPVG